MYIYYIIDTYGVMYIMTILRRKKFMFKCKIGIVLYFPPKYGCDDAVCFLLDGDKEKPILFFIIIFFFKLPL